MSADELLKLQYALLNSLTIGTVIGAQGAGPGDKDWLGDVNVDRLRLLGQQAHAKRLHKIQTILPRTFRCLGTELNRLGSEFGARHPPVTAGSFPNACQFYHFLCRGSAPTAPFLLDLAYCELAMMGITRREPPPAPPRRETLAGPIRMRRRPGIRWRRCRWNLRPLLDDPDMPPASIGLGPVCLLFCAGQPESTVRILEVDEGLLALIASLRDWATLRADQLSAGAGTSSLVMRLEQLGVVEVMSCGSA